MFSELKLIQIQRFNYVIFIICAILLLIASTLDYIIETNRQQNNEISFTPSPAQIAAFTYWILTVRNLSASLVDTIRLYQRRQEILTGESEGSVVPNIRIALGSWLLFFAALSIAIGATELVQEEAEIVII